MRDYIIMTDSCCDLNQQEVDELGLTVLPLSFTIDGKTYLNTPDHAEMSPEEFFAKIAAGESSTTAAANVGQFDEAMGYLDTIREKRFRPADYHPLKGTGINDKATAIAKLKQISHGECAYTFYNFVQRKRWNQLPDYKQNYSHTIDGKTYTITPESTLWIFPFPTSVTSINSLVKQNF